MLPVDPADDEEYEFPVCEFCGIVTDGFNDYGKEDHVSEVIFELPQDIGDRLSESRVVDRFRRAQQRSCNAKCYVIKENTKKIAETREQIRLIEAILDGSIRIRTLFDDALSMGFSRRTLSDISVYNLSTSRLEEMRLSIEHKQHDIEVLRELQPVI